MFTRRLPGTVLAAVLAVATPLLVSSPAAAAPSLEASWEMNEAPGASVLVDSGPYGLHTPFTPTAGGIRTGFVYQGATGYQWRRRDPTLAPAVPERVIQIGDHPRLDPLSDTFTIEIRYRTKEKFGNITQKGQSATAGGQWKIQNPQGRPSCLYKGSIRQGAVRSAAYLNDNQWHVLRCVKTPTQVELWVDGRRVGVKRGAVGHIDNDWPMTIGGKHKCDQIKVTCDYFSGEIDYVRVLRGS